MKRVATALWNITRLSLKHAPGSTLGSLVELLGIGLEALLPFVVGLAVAGISSHDHGMLIWAAIGIIASFGVGRALSLMGLRARINLFEVVGAATDVKIAEMLSSGTTVDRVLDPKYQDVATLLAQQRGVLGRTVNSILVNAANIIRSLVVIFITLTVDWRMLFIALAAVPGYLLLPWWEARLGRSETATARYARQSRELVELAGHDSVRTEASLLGGRQLLTDRVQTAIRSWRKPLGQEDNRRVLVGAIDSAFQMAVAAIVLAMIASEALNDSIDPAALVVAVMSVQALSGVVFSAGFAASTLGRVWRALDRYGQLLTWPEAATAKVHPSHTTGDIVLNEVSYRYPGHDRDALDSVSVRIPSGSLIVVVGENGAGKTTLTSILLGLITPSSGRAELPRARTGVLQDFATFEVTLADSVDVGRNHADTELREALDRNAIHDDLNQQLGERWPGGVNYSGGQAQRIALARGTLADADLVILDEPSAALDPQAEAALFENLISIARAQTETGSTIVIVTHRFAVVDDADIVLVMQAGRLVQAGPPATLKLSDGVFRDMYLTARALHSLPAAPEPTNQTEEEEGDEHDTQATRRRTADD